jgi:hypothetical protein
VVGQRISQLKNDYMEISMLMPLFRKQWELIMGTPKSGKTKPIIIDKHQLETLASIGCTMNEMASFFRCSVDTISRNYAESLIIGRDNGKVSVRRMMWEQAKQGNSTALKYLVHNILREKIEDHNQSNMEASTANQIMEKLSTISTEAILSLVKDKHDKVS